MAFRSRRPALRDGRVWPLLRAVKRDRVFLLRFAAGKQSIYDRCGYPGRIRLPGTSVGLTPAAEFVRGRHTGLARAGRDNIRDKDETADPLRTFLKPTPTSRIGSDHAYFRAGLERRSPISAPGAMGSFERDWDRSPALQPLGAQRQACSQRFWQVRSAAPTAWPDT
jgi:hypothetical protein